MIALYLLAAHLVGDFVLQTRWQAAGKLVDPWLRAKHVYAYCAPFVPVALWAVWGDGQHGVGRALVFLGALAVLHFLTDSRRFYSTLGDLVGWRDVSDDRRYMEWRTWLDGISASLPVKDDDLGGPPPNPWPAVPLMVDQTLHVCQFALLGGLLLS